MSKSTSVELLIPFTPEIAGLCLSARTTSTPEQLQTLGDLIRDGWDWDLFCNLATQHRVQPLVLATLEQLDPELVPETYQQQIRATAQVNAQQSLILTATLVNLIQAFQAVDLRVLAYKGPILATRAYGNLSFRRFADLDLWVATGDRAAAEQALQAQGFNLFKQMSWESTWVQTQSQVNVDLHQTLTPAFFPLPLNFEDVYLRSQTVNIAGTAIQTLSAEDHLILLAVNLARDHWETTIKLQQICDIAEWLRSHEGLDSKLVIQRATQVGCRRIVLVGVALAHQLLAAPVDALLLQAIEQEPQVVELCRQMQQRLTLLGPDQLPEPGGLGFYWQIRERLPEKLRFLITPNEDDFNYLETAMPADWMYYFVRPVRLVSRGVEKLWKR